MLRFERMMVALTALTCMAGSTSAVAGTPYPTLVETVQFGGNDGCERDRYGRLVCLPGARPGERYRSGRQSFGGNDGCERDGYGRLVCLPGAYPGERYRPRQERFGGNDGCERDRYGRLVCLPGARPGVRYR